jgi:hypothetical protein
MIPDDTTRRCAVRKTEGATVQLRVARSNFMSHHDEKPPWSLFRTIGEERGGDHRRGSLITFLMLLFFTIPGGAICGAGGLILFLLHFGFDSGGTLKSTGAIGAVLGAIYGLWWSARIWVKGQ